MESCHHFQLLGSYFLTFSKSVVANLPAPDTLRLMVPAYSEYSQVNESQGSSNFSTVHGGGCDLLWLTMQVCKGAALPTHPLNSFMI